MKHNLLRYSLLLILLACANTGCKDDTFLISSTEKEDGSGIYVSVMVNTGGSNVTKAGTTPTPGENGDGSQHGEGDENKISDLVLFFFQGEETEDGTRLGINSSHPETIKVTPLHFSNNELYGESGTDKYDAIYFSATKEVGEMGLQIGQTYDVLVVANIDYDPVKAPFEINTLQDLQNAAFTDIMEKIKNNNKFAMSSAVSEFNAEKGINSVTIQANNTKNNPAVVRVDVERMVARIDCHISENGNYDVTGRPGDKVTLESFIVVNKYIANVDLENNYYSYWFKRVADTDNLSTNPDITYLGDETTSNNIASNYVIGPMTLTPPQIIDRTENFPYDHSLYYNKNNHSGWKDNWISTTDLLKSQLTSTHNDVTYHFLDYVQENILPVDVLNQANGMAYYCTGIVFKAQYQPADINTTDGTFYRYNGNFYASLDEIKKVIGNQSISENNLSQFGITKYQDGICYYTYFIKHAEDGDDTTVSPMEYAIVRNNIYQVNVKGINDIGTVTPTDYRLNLECTVAEWIQEDEITIDFNNNYNGTIAATSIKKATFTDSTVPEENGEWVIVAYSQDNVLREPQFSFYMKTPVGVGWTAHLTNPDDFEFVSDYQGIGGGNPVTLQIRPRRAFEEGVIRTTEMYITTDLYNEPVAFNQGTETFPGSEQAIRIRQVSTTEYDTSKDNT